jgi:hypothetical protein
MRHWQVRSVSADAGERDTLLEIIRLGGKTLILISFLALERLQKLYSALFTLLYCRRIMSTSIWLIHGFI